jgi:hypothetical protein
MVIKKMAGKNVSGGSYAKRNFIVIKKENSYRVRMPVKAKNYGNTVFCKE